jgi:hypothetical protein
MPIPTSRSLFVFLRFTLSPLVTECPYQHPGHCSSLYVLFSLNKSLNAHINFQVIVRLSPFYSQSTSHWMPISTFQSFFVSLRFTLSPRVTECPYQLPSHYSSLYVLLSVHESLNAHINFPVIVRLSPFYSQYTSHWMPISTSKSLFVSHRFTLSPQVTECPYQLPGHCSSLYVLLSVHKSLNVHINFPVIVRLSTFYSQSTSHWMPISTSQSLFVSLRFTLSPKSLNTHINFPLIVRLSTFYSLPQVTEYPYQLPTPCSSLYVLLSVHKSLNAHINFPAFVRLSTFYSQSTSHWMSISTSHSLFVSLRFTLSPQVTECPYQLPGHCSSLSVLLSVHNSLNAHINFQVIVRLSPFYSQSTIHWMPISTSQSLFVFLCFTLSTRVTECPYQLPSHFSSIYVLLSVNMSLNVHINFPVIVRLSLFYSQSTTLWMPISTSHSLFVSLRFTLSQQFTEGPYQLPGH